MKRKKFLKKLSRKKKRKKSNKSRIRIFKIILIFILLILFFLLFLYPSINLIYIKQEKNNNWIKNNASFINYFLSNYKCQDLNEDLKRFENYLTLKIFLKEENSPLNIELKEQLRNEFEKRFKKNVSKLKNIFFKRPFNFGNHIAGLNNAIYYCEILGIKNIYFNSEYNWFIKNDINTDKIHIALFPQKNINCSSQETLCGLVNFDFFYPMVVKSERRSLILKEEIKKNLPKINVNKQDLYIYIRSGDSFQVNGNGYTPAPYCFYKKLLSKFKFENIYIISMDNKSPITKQLLLDYPNIKHELQSLEKDIASLIYAYNLVNAFSSFSQVAISFNDNLINLFEYEIYKVNSFILHFHYDIDKLNKTFNIYRMKPSEDYFSDMYNWRNTESQREILFKDNCKYGFRKTKYYKTILE